jgi:Zn-dependent M28 family amino/carboxypeptidase
MRKSTWRPIGLCACLALVSCGAPEPTSLTQAQRASIAALAESVDPGTVYDELAAYFAQPREPYEHRAALDLARDHIIAELEGSGCAVETVPVSIDNLIYATPDGTRYGSYYTLSGRYTMDNIFGRKAGSNPDLAPVVVCAHYDTVNLSPGVDDNGSGCVGVLELARRLAGARFERGIVFAVFAFEESGLCGSTAWVDSLTDAQLPESVIDFETMSFTSGGESQLPGSQALLGLPVTGDFLGAFGSEESRSLVMDFVSAAGEFAPGLKVFGCSLDSNYASDPFLSDAMRSDHSPFWTRGVPALMITDTANLRIDAPYHSPEDDLAHVDRVFLCNAIKAGLGAVCIRAGIQP